MKISMTGLEKGDLLTQVTAWAGWTILTMHETFIILNVELTPENKTSMMLNVP
jgi:hypothetical protein